MFPLEGISRFNLRKELLEDTKNKKPLMIRAFYFCLPIIWIMVTRFVDYKYEIIQ